jgi:hypothetical protein
MTCGGRRCWGGESVHFCFRRHGCMTMALECFFRRPRALWGGCVVRKYWLRSVQGMVGGQDDVAVFKRM